MALFTDDFTDTNGEAWDAAKWTTDGVGSVAHYEDIQSNKGRLQSGTALNDWAAAKGIVTPIQDQEILLYCDGTNSDGTDTQLLFVWLRSDGQMESTHQGRPSDGFAARIALWSGTTEVRLVQRLADVETGNNVGTSRTADSAFWVRFRVVTNGVTVDLSCSSWDDGSGEPGSWDGTWNAASPGALLSATGVPQLTAYTWNDTYTVDARIDDVTWGPPGLTEDTYGVRVDLDKRQFVRIVG